jgi:nucleoid DNA-binding protein
MTHSDLVKELSTELGKTQKEIDEFIKALASKVHEKVASGEKVIIKDLVTIDTKVKEAHKARNPKTGETIDVEEKTVPVVKAVTALKDVVNK